MTTYNECTEKLLVRDLLDVENAAFLTGRSKSWVYNNQGPLGAVYKNGFIHVDTELTLKLSIHRPSNVGLDLTARKLLQRRHELKAEAMALTEKKETVAVSPEGKSILKGTAETFEVKVTTAGGCTAVTEITEGDKLITLQGETIQVTKAILPTGDTVAVHHVQPTTEEEVTDAHSIPEVTLKSDTDSMYSFSNLFDAIAITLIAIFFTTAVLMVAFKIQLFGLSWHNLTDLVHFIEENFLGFL